LGTFHSLIDVDPVSLVAPFSLRHCDFVGSVSLDAPLMGYRLGPIEILLALLAFSYPLYVTALAVWLARRRNKIAQGPFTYSFDADGMHTSGSAFRQTIQWEAIHRIRRTRRFLFIFIAPCTVYCIPLRSISDPRFFYDLRSLAGGRADFGSNAAVKPTSIEKL
jgi:hypothetical protein